MGLVWDSRTRWAVWLFCFWLPMETKIILNGWMSTNGEGIPNKFKILLHSYKF